MENKLNENNSNHIRNEKENVIQQFISNKISIEPEGKDIGRRISAPIIMSPSDIVVEPSGGRSAITTPTSKHIVPVRNVDEKIIQTNIKGVNNKIQQYDDFSHEDDVEKINTSIRNNINQKLSADEIKVYSNLTKLNNFFLDNCSIEKINNLTNDEIDKLIDKDIEHVFATMYVSAKKNNKKILDIYETKRDFLHYMYDQSLMDIELTKLNKEFEKLQKEFNGGKGFEYEFVLPLIKERITTCKNNKVKLRLQQIYDAFKSSLTLETFLPKSKRNKQVTCYINNSKFQTNYENEKKKFINILETDTRKYIIHPQRIEFDIEQILSIKYPNGQMNNYIKPFLYTIYREINKNEKIDTVMAVFLIFFLSNINAIMNNKNIEYAETFTDNVVRFMQRHYEIIC